MQLEGSVALVTGANRGLGRDFTRALLAAGASKVYAGARNPEPSDDPAVVPVRLDVTDPAQVADAAARLTDVTLVINNAGIGGGRTLLADDTVQVAREQIEVNYLGPLTVARAFAPVLAANGGGALVNIHSVLSWLAHPSAATYSASKAAVWSLTNSLRTVLRAQGTQVLGVHVGYIDTDMTEGIEAPKLTPAEVTAKVLEGIAAGREEVLVDQLSADVKSALPNDLELLYPNVQAEYDQAVAAATA